MTVSRARLAVLFILAFSLALGAIAGSAVAEDEIDPEEFRRFGWYAGISAVIGFEDFKEDGGANIHPSAGLSAVLGVRGHEYAAFEIEAEWIDEFEVGDGKYESFSLILNAQLHFPLGRFDPYLAYGAGFLWASTPRCSQAPGDFPCRSDSNFELGSGPTGPRADLVLQGGGGLDFYLDENLVVFTEVMYVAPFQDVDGFRYVSASTGLKYRF